MSEFSMFIIPVHLHSNKGVQNSLEAVNILPSNSILKKQEKKEKNRYYVLPAKNHNRLNFWNGYNLTAYMLKPNQS